MVHSGLVFHVVAMRLPLVVRVSGHVSRQHGLPWAVHLFFAATLAFAAPARGTAEVLEF